jgi:hypothetical protein
MQITDMTPTSTMARIRPSPIRQAGRRRHYVVPAAAVYKAPRKWTVFAAFTLAVAIHIAAVITAGMKFEPPADMAQNLEQIATRPFAEQAQLE